MSVLRTLLSAVVSGLAPDSTTTRHRARSSFETLLTLAITVLAIVMAVAYQVLGWRASGRSSQNRRPS